MEILLLLWLAPIIIVGVVANARNRSRHYCWWPFFLGLFGLVIAVAILVIKDPGTPDDPRPRRESEERFEGDRRVRDRGAAGSRWTRHYLNECSDCTREGPACADGRDLWVAARRR